MAEVALQAYENEIDQMIEEARYLEALAHLRHILNKYPRYLGAYYLLGKMLLEADLPELAVDMFRRVLNADPEHFLARIGLGLAHDHLSQPQAAIWNLEQAFELASGDEAIHDELRRLVGQRDGATPDHIPMSRAGLARLYLRGNLFSRAVEEFRALVAIHPERADLQVALTEAYWRDDQIVLAAESCQKILDTFPYSLKANLLLGVLLQNSGQEGSARYLQRAQEVDPENRVAGTLFGANGPVPIKSRTIERLVYDPATLDVDQKARWFRNLEAASVSVGISETMPQMTETEMRLVDVTADLESQIQIPEWLRDLGPLEEIGGEAESTEWAEEESGESEDIIGYEELAGWLEPQKAETPAAVEDAAIPDWLQSLQPPDVEAALGTVSDEEIPEWLRDMQPAESSTIPPRPSEDQAKETLPDWLAELRPAETAAATAGIAAAQNLADEELPEWLREAAPADAAPESESPATEEEDLGWLKDLQASAPTMTPAAPTDAVESDDMFGWEAFSGHEPEAIAEKGEDIEALPDWLADLKPPVAEAEAEAETETTAAEAEGMFGWLSFPEAEPAATEAAPAAEEELPDWLAELKPPVAAAEAGIAAAEEEALEELPEWLAELKPPVTEAKAETEPVSAEAEEMFGWLSFPESKPTVAEAAPAAEEELPDWLAELKPPVAAAEAGIAAAEEEALEELPEWLSELKPPVAESKAEAEPAAAKAEEMFGWLSFPEAEPAAAEAAPAAEEELPEWLAELKPPVAAAETGIAAEAEEEALEELPEWLSELKPSVAETKAEAEPAAAEAAPAAEEELPDWLAELKPPVAAAETGIAAEAEEEALEELPEWLSELKPPVAEAKAEAEPAAAEAEEMFGWLSFPEAEPAAAEAAPAAEEELPEWLAELKPPVAAAETGIAAEAEEEALEELPEWLSELKPSVAEAKAEAEPAAAEVEEMFGWLSFPETEPAAAEAVPAAEEELPEWLAELKPPVAAAETGIAAEAEEEALEELPEWLAELKPPIAAAEAGIAAEAEEEALEELPEWLSELKPPVAETKAEAEPVATEAEEMFGWLSFPESEPAAAEVAPAAEEELPEWLAELKPPVAAAEAGIAAEAEEEALEELPEWLSELKPPVAETKAEAEPVATEAEEMFGWLSFPESEPAAAEVAPAAEEELPEWLAELKPPVAAAEAAVAAKVEEETLEELPEWLSELKPPVASAETGVAAKVEEEALEELPEWLAELKPPAAPAETGITTGVSEPAIPSLEGEMMSGDDALAWLASLAAGKEDQLRAQAEVETRARVDEIMGRKPTAPLPTLEPEAPAPVAEPVAVEPVVAETPAPGEGIALPAEEPAVPSLEGEMMSGDDALAWLASLAAGKEEQLRAQAEVETRARVDEIMGRKPTAPLPTLEPEAPAPVAEPVAVEPVVAETPAPGEGIALPAEEPAVPSLEGEMMSGDDALAWLASLAAGKEEQLRAQAEVETRARVDEIMGRKPTAPLPTLEPEAPAPVAEPVAVEPVVAETPAPGEGIALPAEEPAIPSLEGEMMSGDDALAWLASLAAGKEEQLRAQAEVETRARVDEIMGRKPTAPLPTLEPEAPAPVAEPVAVEPVVAETPAPGEGIALPAEEPAVPSLEGEMMSGDDALAWLASLAAGKEEQLRAQAEAETRARVDEIMGRKPTAPLPTLEPEAPAPVAEPVAVEATVAEPAVAEAVAPEEGPALPAGEPAIPSLEGEMMSGDDALAWLASLAAGKEEQLRAQAEVETRARVDEIMGRKPTAPLPTLEPEAPAPVAVEAPVVEPTTAEAPAPEEGIALEAEVTESEAEETAAIMLTAEEEIPAALEEIISAGAPVAAATVAAQEEEAFFGWSGFEPEVAEAETIPEPEILEPEALTPTSFLHAGPDSETPVDQRPEEVKIAEPVLAQPEPSAPAKEAPPIEAAPPVEAVTPAVDALRARVQADAKDYPSRLELARALVSQEALQEAMDHYGRLVRERQSLIEIETDLTQLLERQPDDPRPLQTLGDLNMQKGRLDKAMEFYKRALSKL